MALAMTILTNRLLRLHILMYQVAICMWMCIEVTSGCSSYCTVTTLSNL